MPLPRALLGVVIVGTVCGAIASLTLGATSLLCAALVVIGLPMLTVAASLGHGTDGDAAGRCAAAVGGLAVSCWSLWVAGVTFGLQRWALLAAPVAASALVVAFSSVGGVPRPATLDRRAEPGLLAATPVWVTAAIAVVLVLVPFLPYGLERADGVHRMGMTDWYKHLMVTAALQGGEFPPSNPFLITDAGSPYYYGFHLLAVGVQKASGAADAYPLLLFLTLLAAGTFPLVVFVLARGLFGDHRRAATAAAAATLLAGFDLVVWVLHAICDVASAWPLAPGLGGLRAAVPSTHLDFWIHHNERQFNPPYVSLIWAPQHVLAVMVVLLVLHLISREAGERRSARAALVPAIMLAALPALSAYVAIGFVCGVLMSAGVDSWRSRRLPWRTATASRWGAAGLLSAAAALPVAWVLEQGDAGRLVVAVSSAGGLLNGAVFSTALGDGAVARLLDTPMLSVVEFGLVGLLAAIAVRARLSRGALSDQQREAVAIATGILVLVTFVRPAEGGPNNLYARPMLLAWSLLACFAADAWCAGRGRRWWGRIGVAVGAGGIVLAAVGATAEGFAFWATPPDVVAAARWVNVSTPPDAVVAADPDRHNLGYWLRRRTVIADGRHARLFGATAEQYDRTLERLRAAYAAGAAAEAAKRFGDLGADVVVADSPAPAWAQPPCFQVGYRGTRVTVLMRSRAGCAP